MTKYLEKMAPRHRLETPPRRLLRQSKAALARQVVALARDLNRITSEVVPVTIERDMRPGDTLMVRVPKLFVPR